MRVRPWSDREKQSSIVPVVHALSHKNEISVIKENYTNHKKKFVYHFDQVFTNFSTQEELFEVTLQPMITEVMKGFESTVFAYGQ